MKSEEKRYLIELTDKELTLIKKYLIENSEVRKENVRDDLSLDNELIEEEIEYIEEETNYLISALERIRD